MSDRSPYLEQALQALQQQQPATPLAGGSDLLAQAMLQRRMQQMRAPAAQNMGAGMSMPPLPGMGGMRG